MYVRKRKFLCRLALHAILSDSIFFALVYILFNLLVYFQFLFFFLLLINFSFSSFISGKQRKNRLSRRNHTTNNMRTGICMQKCNWEVILASDFLILTLYICCQDSCGPDEIFLEKKTGDTHVWPKQKLYIVHVTRRQTYIMFFLFFFRSSDFPFSLALLPCCWLYV
jgi:hypothetical protein